MGERKARQSVMIVMWRKLYDQDLSLAVIFHFYKFKLNPGCNGWYNLMPWINSIWSWICRPVTKIEKTSSYLFVILICLKVDTRYLALIPLVVGALSVPYLRTFYGYLKYLICNFLFSILSSFSIRDRVYEVDHVFFGSWVIISYTLDNRYLFIGDYSGNYWCLRDNCKFIILLFLYISSASPII